jgi:DNA-directed RNA polymerase specialized sigma24 family protein
MPEKTTSKEESPTRRVVRLKTAKGWTPREIALSLGISTQAVYKHLAKIREDGNRRSA